MALLALYFGRLRHLSYEAGLRIISELEALPRQVDAALESNDDAKRIAEKYASCNNFLYLGRQYNFPIALEGALKLKEISYIHAEGYPAAEMKHGPIALVDENTPSVFIVPQGAVYRQGDHQHGRDQGPRRAGDRRSSPKATPRRPSWPTT